MDQDLRFDVALSYSSEDAWVGKDLHSLVTQFGFSVYSYDSQPDRVHGFLRTKLLDIYRDSSINVLVWSRSYGSNPKESFVAMERRCLTGRHIEKGEAESLFILSMDDNPLPRDLEDVLVHNLQKEGLVSISRIIVARLKQLHSHDTEFGLIRHPDNTEIDRGRLYACSFRINPSFQSDRLGRWRKYGDVLVDFPNPLQTRYVYLIPSGGATPLLRHTQILKEDPNLLEDKRKATMRFVNDWEGRELKGFWFCMRKGEIQIATVYSPAYDKFLNSSLHLTVQ
jgi:hypothetical protein